MHVTTRLKNTVPIVTRNPELRTPASLFTTLLTQLCFNQWNLKFKAGLFFSSFCH